jgi:ribosomal protein S18 acetylase RimI-like enzyme
VVALHFRPIDVERDGARCVAFSRDAFVCSFGSDERFLAEAGPAFVRYLQGLHRAVAVHPEGAVHLYREGAIIGQLVMEAASDATGYVSLVYVVPEWRGTEVGAALHAYIVDFFRRRGVETARLSVSPTNARAMAYYRKHGWRDLGPFPGHEYVHLMQLAVD